MKTLLINPLFIFIFLLSVTLSAQARGRSFERIKAHKMTYIVENSSLSPEEETLFWEIFGASEDTLYKIIYRKKKAIKSHLKENCSSLTSEEIKAKIERLDQLENEKVQATINRNKALLNKLPSKKVLEILTASDQFSKEMYHRRKKGDKSEERKNSN